MLQSFPFFILADDVTKCNMQIAFSSCSCLFPRKVFDFEGNVVFLHRQLQYSNVYLINHNNETCNYQGHSPFALHFSLYCFQSIDR